MRASDIHLQRFEDRLQVRYRIDGVLYDMEAVPEEGPGRRDLAASRSWARWTSPSAASRRTAARRSRSATARSTSASRRSRRTTASASSCGSSTRRRTSTGSSEIGLSAEHLETVREFSLLSHGIIFVTGPTGSGKTTTLYGDAVRDQVRREERDHDRGPDRVPPAGHQPDPGVEQEGPHVRGRPALPPAPGPRHHDGRRGPRRGDGAHRDPGRAHRPPRVLDAAHQRLGGRGHAHARHRRRALPRRLLADRRDRPAPRPHDLQGVPRGVRPGRRSARGDRGPQDEGQRLPGRKAPPRPRLRRLLQHRLRRTDRDLRDPARSTTPSGSSSSTARAPASSSRRRSSAGSSRCAGTASRR